MFIPVSLLYSLSKSEFLQTLCRWIHLSFSIRKDKRELTNPSTDHRWNPALQFCSTTHWRRWGGFISNFLELVVVFRYLTRCSIDHILLPACWCRYREDELRLFSWKLGRSLHWETTRREYLGSSCRRIASYPCSCVADLTASEMIVGILEKTIGILIRNLIVYYYIYNRNLYWIMSTWKNSLWIWQNAILEGLQGASELLQNCLLQLNPRAARIELFSVFLYRDPIILRGIAVHIPNWVN